MRRALVLRHLGFEHVGVWRQSLDQRGFALDYLDAPRQDLSGVDVDSPDLLIVLGGPVGVHDANRYPFLQSELALVKRRLASGRPLLGICLGAQQIAHALGAQVAPMGNKEIGFGPITLTPAGAASPLRHLGDHPVLHWHGDAFGVPAGAESLAATRMCPHQAFAIGPNVLALQFHLEVDCMEIEDWLVGHCAELAVAGIDPCPIRADAARHGATLNRVADTVLGEWIDGWQTGPVGPSHRSEPAAES